MAGRILNVVQVGVGGRGRPHLRAQMALPELFRVTGLVDVAPAAFQEARAITGLPVAASFPNLTEALAAVPCDAVSVVTPGHLHTPFMEEALAAGKHVIVEKPFTCNLAEAERVVTTAERKSLRVVVTQNDKLFHPYPWIRAAIADGRYGELGTVTLVHHSARGRPFENGDPPMHLWHQGSHQIDTLLALVGRPPRHVWGVNAIPAFSDWPAAPFLSSIIEFDGPVIVTYMATSDARAYEFYLRVECRRAAITLQSPAPNSADSVLRVTPHQPRDVYPRSEEMPFGRPERVGGWADVERKIWTDFWEHVVNGAPNESSGRNNLATMRVMAAILRSSQQGARVTL